MGMSVVLCVLGMLCVLWFSVSMRFSRTPFQGPHDTDSNADKSRTVSHARTRAQVMSQLRGEAPLPWEGELSAHTLRQLGAFKGPVLQLLRRDPARRASMRSFHDACTKLFASVSTVEA